MDADVALVRTTVAIREDFYQRLRKDPAGLSAAINAILAKEFKRDHSLFGTSQVRDSVKVRDKRDRL